MAKTKKIVSVVLPTFNEKENIEKFTQEVLEQEKKLPGWEIHVVVADSNSPDGTGEIASKMAARNPKIHYIKVERGIGVGLIKGHQYALEKIKPDILAQMDADGQVEVNIVPKLVETIMEGYTFAIGSRLIPGGKNNLSFSRKFFTVGSSWFCRLVLGPFDIKEFTNSARAFTPELFRKINLEKLPWREKSFINQPAFLHEAVLAGAKYKEVPLTFKNRAEGYSKNKVINYVYDIITYAIDVRFHKWGVNIPFFYLTRRAKTIIKFAVVGIIGTLVDFAFYNLFIGSFSIRPATSKGISTAIAIFNNFNLNNFWTFRYRKTNTNYLGKLLIFYVVSSGGLAISVLIVKFLHLVYGDGIANVFGMQIPFYNMYFFATIPPVMIWNFTINHYVTWKKHQD